MNQEQQSWNLFSSATLSRIIRVLALAMSIFHLYTGGRGVFTALIQRSAHLAFVLALTFLIYSARKGKNRNGIPIYDFFLLIAGVVPCFYLAINYENIALREGIATSYEIAFGIVTTLILLEAARRAIGWPLVIISGCSLLYAYLGPYLPGVLAHRGYSIERIAYQMYLTQSGIFGIPLGVCATIIFLFILFGAFLDKGGGSKFFIDFATTLTGRTRGGPAKASVVSSGMMATVSGSAVANVVTTGTFTIPLMIKTGYRPFFAGAVEAVASSGGQLTPPIMGAAAFIMAEMTEIPYVKIALAAALPAFLFYFSIFMVVHLEAVKLGIRPLTREETPSLTEAFQGAHLFLPITVLIYLLIRNYSPMFVAFWTIVFTIAISMTRGSTRLNWRKLFEALEVGAKNILPVSIACASAGIIIGAVTLTGLGLKFSSLLISLSGGSKLLLLFLTMVASIILGMGLPTAPAYILLATLVAPALERVGVPLIAAHLFIFYFGIISAITPPVALASYAAAGICRDNPYKVGMTACWIGIATYIVPYMFVYGPALVNIGTTSQVLVALLTALIGILALAAAVEGFLFRRCLFWERALLLSSSLLLIRPGLITDMGGLGIFLVVGMMNYFSKSREF